MIQDILPRHQTISDGTMSAFQVPFPLFNKAAVEVYVGSSKTDSSDYTVDVETSTITFNSAPTANSVITILRLLPISWEDKFNSALDKESLEEALSLVIAKVQTLEESVSRAPKTNPYDEDTGDNLSKQFFQKLQSASDSLAQSQVVYSQIQVSGSQALTDISTEKASAIADINANAVARTNEFDNNASAKTTAFNNNADDVTDAFNNHAESVTNSLVETFNTNASEKTTDFNNNVTSKISDFNTNAVEKTTAFDNNAAEKQASVDASANAAALSEANAASSESSAAASEARCEEIFQSLGIVIKIKGRVDSTSLLPAAGELEGDAYQVGPESMTNFPVYYWYDNAWRALGGGGSSEWGSIQGTLSNQSDLQQALDSKQAVITGAASTITSDNLTPNTALETDDDGKVTNSSVTSTELSYLSGVTSAVQTQLDSKAADSNVVHKTGGETIGGDKTFTKHSYWVNDLADDAIVQKHNDYDRTETPTELKQRSFRILDKNSKIVGDFRTYAETSGTVTSAMLARKSIDGVEKTAQVTARVGADGALSAYAPSARTSTPGAIITWNDMQIVSSLPENPVAGVFYFVKE